MGRGGNVEVPEGVLFALGPCEKGLRGEWGEKRYRGGVNWAVPSVPIRALTDQRLWARVGET